MMAANKWHSLTIQVGTRSIKLDLSLPLCNYIETPESVVSLNLRKPGTFLGTLTPRATAA